MNRPTIVDVTEQDRDWWDADELRYVDGTPVLTEDDVDDLLDGPRR